MILGLVGFIGSGKNTTAAIIESKYSLIPLSFAGSVKDLAAAVFGWDRHLLEGQTDESRKFRETIDEWWSSKLNRPITPRFVLQNVGTELFRNHFDSNIWVYSLLKKITKDKNYVITDARFLNEINAIKQHNGIILRIKRGPEPVWFDTARLSPQDMSYLYPHVHISEFDWLKYEPDYTISNDGNLIELEKNIDTIMKNIV